jgi:hypothetical protein
LSHRRADVRLGMAGLDHLRDLHIHSAVRSPL